MVQPCGIAAASNVSDLGYVKFKKAGGAGRNSEQLSKLKEG